MNKTSRIMETIKEPLVWIDCEMTGLDIQKDHLLEIAVIITDGNLNIVDDAHKLEVVIHQPKEVMDSMNEWCIQHHGDSGLTQRVFDSEITVQEAEKQVFEFLKKHVPPGIAPVAGNSVHEDKKYLRKYMPSVADHLHYRIVDVSTIKELCKRWYPEVASGVNKKLTHRAMDDIIESIEELKYYREHVFNKANK